MNLIQFIEQGVSYALISIKQEPKMVTQIQDALNKLGYNAGPVDGEWGIETDLAYRIFCHKNDQDYSTFSPATAQILLSSTATKLLDPLRFPPKSLSASSASLNLIRRYESLALLSYKDLDGAWVIGYGHRRTAFPSQHITEVKAESLLKEDVAEREAMVHHAISVEINQGEFDALVSFAFTISPDEFFKSSLVRLLNLGDRRKAADEFLRWIKSGDQIVPGLIERRQAERALFLSRSLN